MRNLIPTYPSCPSRRLEKVGKEFDGHGRCVVGTTLLQSEHPSRTDLLPQLPEELCARSKLLPAASPLQGHLSCWEHLPKAIPSRSTMVAHSLSDNSEEPYLFLISLWDWLKLGWTSITVSLTPLPNLAGPCSLPQMSVLQRYPMCQTPC